ncbi:MAG TPA: PH domain-containing protein [Longilinea sp.]|nr:PH domain-containing protein [Longilinea sp.]
MNTFGLSPANPKQEPAIVAYPPDRKRGLVILGAIAIFLLAASGVLFWLAMQEQYGSFFVLFILFSILLLIPAIFFVYRWYALLQSNYGLERDGIHLRWGLRVEDIPLPEVEWIRLAANLPDGIALPWMSLPGAILGVVNDASMGQVEFMASEVEGLLLIGTAKRVYAISPINSSEFLRSFQDSMELGSLTPIPSYSTEPVNYIRHVWYNPWARWPVIAGFLLGLLVLVIVSLMVPRLGEVSIGFTPQGTAAEPVPARQLLLIPILGLLVFFSDLIVGLYLYRKPKTVRLAYWVWAGGVITPLLLLASLAFILL